MITREFKECLADRFTSAELVDLLAIPVEDVIETFDGEIEERFDDICDIIGWRENAGSTSGHDAEDV